MTGATAVMPPHLKRTSVPQGSVRWATPTMVAGVAHAARGAVAVEARAVPGDDGRVAPTAGAGAGALARGGPSRALRVARLPPRVVAAARRASARRSAARAAALRSAARCSWRSLRRCSMRSSRRASARSASGELLGVDVPGEHGTGFQAIGVEGQGDLLRLGVAEEGRALTAAHRVRAIPREGGGDRVTARVDDHGVRGGRRPERLDDTPPNVRKDAETERFEAAGRPVGCRGRCGRCARSFWDGRTEPRMGYRHDRHDKGGGKRRRSGRLGGPGSASATSRGVARHDAPGARARRDCIRRDLSMHIPVKRDAYPIWCAGAPEPVLPGQYPRRRQ